ncbi:hypothetical protein H5410_058397 [Solanum commersonii]|uniref:Myb-like domain-containing protein n=1 Tax=Solanum commersonii TaxID=4109 RepID=A0A9J5WSL8_SOLCO|nr:hypothetical protein H5410_058397 [Solanum commersonii]
MDMDKKTVRCLKMDFQIAADLAFSRCGEEHVMKWLHTFINSIFQMLIETETLCGTLSLIDLIDKETSLVTLSKKLGQGFSENNETYEVPEKVIKSFEGLTQQNQLNVVVFYVSPHFVDMKKSIEMLSLAKNLVKLPNFVKRNKVVVTNKTKGLVSASRKLKGSMCKFWTMKDDDLLMKKARELPSQWGTISLVLGRTTQSCLD